MTESYLQALKMLAEGKAEYASRPFRNTYSENPERTVYLKYGTGGFYKYVDTEDNEVYTIPHDLDAQWTIKYKEEHKPYEALMVFKGEKVFLEKMMSLTDTLNMWEGPDLYAIFSIDIRDQVYTKIYEREGN